jgi:hypothetical protein
VKNSLQLPSGYQELLQELKARIRGAQVRAAFAVTRELVVLYWSIGREISQRFDREDGAGRSSTGFPRICRPSFRCRRLQPP